MEKTIMLMLKEYCEKQGIELRNMLEVVTEIEQSIDRTLPNIVHEFGEIKEIDDEY